MHCSSLSSTNLAPLSRYHPTRGQGPGPNAFHTAPAAISRSMREERCQAIVINANGFPYSRKLQAHNSCVNALTFSSGDGRFLASGGDDQRIHLWDFYQDDVKTPSFSLRDLKGPLFCLEFSATNRFLFSGGSSDTVLKYDVEYIGSSINPSQSKSLPSANQIFQDHLDSIRAITCHPVQDDLFISASEDGRIIRHDGRSGSTSAGSREDNTIQLNSESTGVQYHPTMEHIFVTSDAKGRVCLRDARMAFGYAADKKSGSNAGVVLTYNTKLTKKTFSYLSNPEASSVVFDREGKKLAVSFVHHLPTIYALSDPNPLAVLSGANLPDGTPNPPNQRTFSNSCTMKHGSFGGPGLVTDDLYASGSDDFRGYVWKIPPLSVLKEQRKEFSVNEWENCQPPVTEVAFTKSHQDMKYLPTEISTPLCRLSGHKTIVNTVVFHPHFLHVVTSGVEKSIYLHSPTPSSPCTQNLSLSPPYVRQLDERDDQADRRIYLNALMGSRTIDGGNDDNDNNNNDEDSDDAGERETISFFDHLLREEGRTDVFLSRRSTTEDDDSEEEDSEEDEYLLDDDDEDDDDVDLLYLT